MTSTRRRRYLQRYLDILDDIPLPNWQPGELADKPPWQAIDHVAAYNSAWTTSLSLA